jgi:hypothetical protein
MTFIGPRYADGGTKVTGYVYADGWLLRTKVDPKRHMLQQPRAWATEAANLLIPGLKGIRLVCLDGTVWEADLRLWQERGFAFNRGHGDQVGLPLEWWKKTPAKT